MRLWNRTSEVSAKQHGAIGCVDRVDGVAFRRNINNVKRATKRATDDCLIWNDERLRIDLIVELRCADYAECGLGDILHGQLCFMTVPAGSQIVVMVRWDPHGRLCRDRTRNNDRREKH